MFDMAASGFDQLQWVMSDGIFFSILKIWYDWNLVGGNLPFLLIIVDLTFADTITNNIDSDLYAFPVCSLHMNYEQT